MESDALFPPAEQEDMHNQLSHSQLVILKSFEGHDGFLLEFEQMSVLLMKFFNDHSADFKTHQELLAIQSQSKTTTTTMNESDTANNALPAKASVFGEVEDLMMW